MTRNTSFVFFVRNLIHMQDFLIENWGELLVGFMAFVKIIVNLTPTEKDNKVFGLVDMLIDAIIKDRKK